MNKSEVEAAISTLETLVQVFGVIVAVGIVGEVGFGLRLWILNRRHSEMQRAEDFAQQAEIARLNKEAGDARRDAANAEVRAR